MSGHATSSGRQVRREIGRHGATGPRIPRLVSAGFAAAILVAACSSGGTPAPATAPASAPSASAIASAAASLPAPAGKVHITPGPDLCTLLGAADFTAAGVSGAGSVSKNSPDTSDFYCVYAGKSGATGGIEFDAVVADSATIDDTFKTVSEEMGVVLTDVTSSVPGADKALLATAPPVIVVRSGNLVFDISFPSSPTASGQLATLAALVIQRAAALP